MSVKRVGGQVRDPVDGVRQVNVMPSGLTHCADSMAGGREGQAIIHFGMPGDPLTKSQGVKSGYAGNVPNLTKKFMRQEQH
jgi:hypothetical protein